MDIQSLIATVLNVFNYSTALLILVIFLLIKLLIWNNKKKNQLYWLKKNVTPGELPSLIKVVLLKTRLDVLDQQLVKKYGKVFGVHLFGKPTVICAEPELIGNILSKDFAIFSNRRDALFNNEILDSFMTRVKTDKWKRIRAIVSPTFSSAKLRKMRPIIDDCLQSLINDFNRLIEDNNDVINVKKVFDAFAMNVITRVAFGTKVDALCDESNPILINAKKVINRSFSLVDAPRVIFRFTFPKLANYFGVQLISTEAINFFTALTLKLIEDRKTNKTGVKRYDFLQLLLDSMENSEEFDSIGDKTIENDGKIEERKLVTTNKTMSIAEITSQCVLFFVAGYDSTAATIAYSVYNLACNPQMQQIIFEEAKSVLELKTEIPVDYDLIHGLKYTDAVISETLRLFPPQRALDREAAQDYVLGDRIRISKGDIIQIPITALHKNAENFPEPEKFKPERFFPENREHHSYAYLPFGAGPRNCVARSLALLEAKLALLYSVYNFRFSVTNQTEQPPKIFPNGVFIVPRNVTLKVEKR